MKEERDDQTIDDDELAAAGGEEEEEGQEVWGRAKLRRRRRRRKRGGERERAHAPLRRPRPAGSENEGGASNRSARRPVWQTPRRLQRDRARRALYAGAGVSSRSVSSVPWVSQDTTATTTRSLSAIEGVCARLGHDETPRRPHERSVRPTPGTKGRAKPWQANLLVIKGRARPVSCQESAEARPSRCGLSAPRWGAREAGRQT